MKMAKGNFFVRLCYAVVGKTKDTSKMTTKEVIEEFLRQKGVSSPKDFFTLLRVGNVRKDIGLHFFSNQKEKHSTNTIWYDIPTSLPPLDEIMFQLGEHERTKHHKKHAVDLGYKDFVEYKKGAKDFWINGAGEIYFSQTENKFYKYNAKKQIISAMNSDGKILTFYPTKTKTAFEQIKRRKGVTLWKK